MQKRKYKSNKTRVTKTLNVVQRAVNIFNFMLRHADVNYNSFSLRKLTFTRHSQVGKSFGKVCVRGKSHRKHRFYQRYYVNSISGRLLFSVYNPLLPQTKRSIFMSNENSFQYYTLPFNVKNGVYLYNAAFVPKGEEHFFTKRHGNTVQLHDLNPGTFIYHIATKPKPSFDDFGYPRFVRAAGCRARIVSRLYPKYFKPNTVDSRMMTFACVSMPSKKIMYFPLGAFASVGRVSVNHKYRLVKKNAGYSRRRGCKPKVRGVAMNPIDHPHGGGEGKKSKPRIPRNPWGTPSRFVSTTKFYKIRHRYKQISRMRSLYTPETSLP